jgi:hypothetical protein
MFVCTGISWKIIFLDLKKQKYAMNSYTGREK